MTCCGTVNNEKKKAMLLHLAGPEVQEIFYDDPEHAAEPPNGSDVFKEAVNLLDKHFEPVVCVPHERVLFRRMKQEGSDGIEQFARKLRHQGNLCDYGGALDMRITEQIFDGSTSDALREAILKKRLVVLKDILEEGRILETIELNKQEAVASTSNGPAAVNKVDGGKCFRCGSLEHFANSKKCPALKKKCDKCGLVGHFKLQCRTKSHTAKTKKKKVRQVDSSDEEDSDEDKDSDADSENSEVLHIFSTTMKQSEVVRESSKYNTKISCSVGGVKLKWTVDSGASVNVIDEGTWELLKKKGCKVSYENNETRKKLMAYGNNRLDVKGVFKADISHGPKTVHREIYVIRGHGANLLGKTTSIDLGVLQIKSEVSQVQESKTPAFGKAKGVSVVVELDQKVRPVQQPCRRLPIPLQAVVEAELQKLLDQDVIEYAPNKVTWSSPLVVTPKDGGRKVRLCVDMRRANTAIVPQRYPLPTFDEIMPYLNGCKYFSKIDLTQAFHQLELHPDSREITTFVTPKAYFRFKRLMFGMSIASEVFQRELGKMLKGLEGVKHFIDDILVFGRTREEHDRRLAALMKRIEECGLTVNKLKCQIGQTKVSFMGHLLSSDGILPMEEKVSAIKSFRRPESAEEIRSFLGLANYVGKFIPNLSSISTPLRDMTVKGAKFKWTKQAEKAFTSIKSSLSNPQHLGFYSPESETTLVVDASATGLGAVLLQTDNGQRRVISYASKSLSKTERRYSVLDKEALAIYWAIGRFDMYLRGKFFVVLTDHKPLVKIFATESAPNERQQRWVLNLMGYRFLVRHVPGKANIADPLSRLAQSEEARNCDKDCEKDLCAMVESALPATLTMTELIQAAEEDAETFMLRKAIRTGTWGDDMKRYRPFQNELCYANQVVLRRNKIVVPQSLRERVLDLAHGGHPGSSKMKRRLRAAVWWPGIDQDVDKRCKQCLECQAVGSGPSPEPLCIQEMPSKPWSHLSADFLGPLPNGKYLFVLIDAYSRYCVVEVMTKITSVLVIQRLERIFTRLGLPDILKTDNATNFCSQEFKDYCVDSGIKLTHTTPYWPAANGEVERQNRSILKALKIGQLNGENLEKALQDYLYMYTVTPHAVTGVSPAELMFGRRFKDRFPHLSGEVVVPEEVQERDRIAKYQAKVYRDIKVHAKPSDIQIGDHVLMKNQHRDNKLAPNFNPEPVVVVQKAGNCVTVRTPRGDLFRRNSSHLKPIRSSIGPAEQANEPDVDGETLAEADFDAEYPVAANDRAVTPGIGQGGDALQRPKRIIKPPARFQDYELGEE
ncbi:uncharacterized protein K02A2.6-like [Culex pipiens pallens]|uniref:uncharacterized protein K02A2.6-like n=1 Tax=Culex pipiens pallens TaxID=42434 RepID=UPI0019535350|nr:uncharacterized protein K02A2.6-like [Culex pipiens pallens]